MKDPLIRRIVRVIEHANKAVWFTLFRLLWDNKPLSVPLDPASVRRVLFLRYDAIGDMITTLPTIRIVKELNPAIEIDVLASPRNDVVLKGDPYVSRIYILHHGFLEGLRDIWALRKNRYDVIFCCIFGKATKIGLIANIIGGEQAVKTTTYRGEKYWHLFNVQSKTAYSRPSMWDKMAYIVPDTFHCSMSDADIKPYLSIDAATEAYAAKTLDHLGIRGKFILINLTTKQERNKWEPQKYLKLVQALLQQTSYQILLIWMDEDKTVAEHILSALQEEDVARVSMYPQTKDVLEIASVVGQSRLLISPDTGVVHMASVRHVPVVGLYQGGTKMFIEWAPYRVPHRILVSPVPHKVASIPMENVFAATLELLKECEKKEQ